MHISDRSKRARRAPPCGALKVDEAGEPSYGERDVVDLAAMRELGYLREAMRTSDGQTSFRCAAQPEE